MKKTIIGILVCMLLISSVFASATNDILKVKKNVDFQSLEKSTVTDSFWIDLNPGGGHNGGFFEDEDDKWNKGKVITMDDFDDTSEYINWASGDGIYSHIRDDEDLWDNTSEEGAWYYPEPKSGYEKINSYVAFWKGIEIKG